MAEWFWHSTVAWIGLSGLIVIACLAVAWFIPPLRRLAIEAAVVVGSAAALYAKGSADRAAEERKKSDAAVKRNQEKFEKIDARPDTDDDVDKRLRDGKF